MLARLVDFAKTVFFNFIEYASRYWPLLIVLVLLHLVISFWILTHRDKDAEDSHPAESDAAVMDFFFRKGYEVERVIFQGRMSAEFVLTRLGARTCVHIKWWRKPVGEIPVKEMDQARNRYACEFAVIISKEGFTRAARKLAVRLGVWLWEFNNLESELKRTCPEAATAMKTAAAAKFRE